MYHHHWDIYEICFKVIIIILVIMMNPDNCWYKCHDYHYPNLHFIIINIFHLCVFCSVLARWRYCQAWGPQKESRPVFPWWQIQNHRHHLPDIIPALYIWRSAGRHKTESLILYNYVHDHGHRIGKCCKILYVVRDILSRNRPNNDCKIFHTFTSSLLHTGCLWRLHLWVRCEESSDRNLFHWWGVHDVRVLGVIRTWKANIHPYLNFLLSIAHVAC